MDHTTELHGSGVVFVGERRRRLQVREQKEALLKILFFGVEGRWAGLKPAHPLQACRQPHDTLAKLPLYHGNIGLQISMNQALET